MAYKKINARITGSWSSYAASAFGVIRECGMWDLDKEWYGSFLGLTGICFQIIYDKKGSAVSVTSYDWEKEHQEFMKRIGVEIDLCCSYQGNPHPTAISEIKASLDADRGVVLWGVDTGEFGVIYGYDDNDGILFVSGIGGNDSKESNPVLYQNLISAFGNILFCEFPINYISRPMNGMIVDSIYYYLEHMKSNNPNYGLHAYDNLIYALEHDCDNFGLRYTIGVYTERKYAASSFFNDEIKTLFKNNERINKAAGLADDIAKLYERIHFEILKQDFNGWNHLNKPVDKEAKKAIIPIIQEIVLKEKEIVGIMEEKMKNFHN